MLKQALCGLIGATLSAAALVAFGPAIADLTSRAAFGLLPACAAEDSPGPCAWDASRQGNGRGRSFFVIADHIFRVETGAAQ